MKKTFAFVLIFLAQHLLFAQNSNYQILVGASFPLLVGKKLESNSGTEMKPGFNFGFINGFPIDGKNEIELGAFYQFNQIEVHSFSTGYSSYWGTTKNFIWIPLNYRFNFKQNFYLKTGIVGLIDLSKSTPYFDNYSGLGIGISGGKKFVLTPELGISLNPYLNFNSLVKFTESRHRMVDLGVQLALNF